MFGGREDADDQWSDEDIDMGMRYLHAVGEVVVVDDIIVLEPLRFLARCWLCSYGARTTSTMIT